MEGKVEEVRKMLADRRAEVMERSRAQGTKKRYAAIWKEFVNFCEWMKVEAEPAVDDTVADFVVWWEMTGRGGSVEQAMAAVRARHLDAGWENPCSNHKVRQAVRGIKRIGAEEGEIKEKRDPFPVAGLERWTRRRPDHISEWRWRRDAALVAVGLRCMRRPGELVELRVRDIVRKDGVTWVLVRKSKTDQLGKGKEIPLDEGGLARTCPVKLVWEWIRFAGRRGEEHLFPNLNTGGKWSTAGITSALKEMAKVARIEGKFSGHSLRIGGATAAMKGGMSLALIMAIGGWESPAVMTYLRAVGAAQAKASRKMGL